MLVIERMKEFKGMVVELSDFEEDVGCLGDILNYIEVCFYESDIIKDLGYNELEN